MATRTDDTGVVFRAPVRSLFAYRQSRRNGIPRSCEFNMADDNMELQMLYQNKGFILQAGNHLSGRVSQIFWIFGTTEVNMDSDEEDQYVQLRNDEHCLTIVFTNPALAFKDLVDMAKGILNADSELSRKEKLKLLSNNSSRTSVSIPSASEVEEVDEVEDSCRKVKEWLKNSELVFRTPESFDLSEIESNLERIKKKIDMQKMKMEQEKPKKKREEIKEKSPAVDVVAQERVNVKEEVEVRVKHKSQSGASKAASLKARQRQEQLTEEKSKQAAQRFLDSVQQNWLLQRKKNSKS